MNIARRRHSHESRRMRARNMGRPAFHAATALTDLLEAQQQAPRILVIDNDMISADSLELMLHEQGYARTRVAYSGRAALAIAASFRPDVVLLELGLDDLDGYEVGQLLHQYAQVQRVRLIAITSSRQHWGRHLARDAGFERYLLRPITGEDLSQLLS